MAYDKALAQRIRTLIVAEVHVSEKAMFGGLAFLVSGNMAVAASGQGGLLVHTDPAMAEQLLAAHAEAAPMIMRGKPMMGWMRVPAEALESEATLAFWVELGTAYAKTLPPKPQRQ